MVRPALAVISCFLLAGCTQSKRGSPGVLGLNAMADERFDLARVYFEQARALEPQRLDLIRLEGICWLSGYQRSLSRGLECLETYLAQGESEPQDLRRDAMTRYVNAIILLGELDRYVAHRDWFEDHPLFDLFEAEVNLRLQPEHAVASARRMLTSMPKSQAARRILSEALQMQGRDREALEAGLAAAELDPLQAALVSRLELLARRLDDPELSAELRAVLDLQALVEEGSPAEKLAALRQLHAQYPDSVEVARRLVAQLTESRLLVEARALFETTETTFDVDLWLGQLQRAHAAGGLAWARDLVEVLLQEDGGNKAVLWSAAQIALQQGRLQNAEELVNRGLAAYSEYGRFHALRAHLADRRGESDRAIEHLSAALELAPWRNQWRLRLANHLLGGSDRAGALDLLKDAPEDSGELRKMVDRLEE